MIDPEAAFELIQLHNEISRKLVDYSTALTIVKPEDNMEIAQLIGSGTFVIVNNRHCILTADHVMQQIPNSGQLGLAISANEHRFMIDVTHITKIRIERGNEEESGPDLALIILPEANIGWIEAHKSFYNMDTYKKEEVLKDPPPNNSAIWFLCGAIEEFSPLEESFSGYASVKNFELNCGGTIVVAQYRHDNYDYIEVEAKYEEKSNLPNSFGGTSGGGIWYCPVKKPQDKFVIEDTYLMGVAFYESPINDNRRRIKGHGLQSIYVTLYEKLENKI